MFSKIGSFIGVPLYADNATSTLSRLSFSRLCVEVDAKVPLHDKVPLVNKNSDEFLQKVVYEWLPSVCSHCCLFGHSNSQSRFGGKQKDVHQEEVGPIVKKEFEGDSIVDKIPVASATRVPTQSIPLTNGFDVLNNEAGGVEEKSEIGNKEKVVAPAGGCSAEKTPGAIKKTSKPRKLGMQGTGGVQASRKSSRNVAPLSKPST